MEYVYYIIGGLAILVGAVFFLIHRSTKSIADGFEEDEKERSRFKHP